MENQVRLFLDDLFKRRRYSANTIQAYRNDLTQLLNFVQVEKPYLAQWLRVDKPLLITFLSHLSARQYTPASISRKVAVIKSFFHFLHNLCRHRLMVTPLGLGSCDFKELYNLKEAHFPESTMRHA